MPKKQQTFTQVSKKTDKFFEKIGLINRYYNILHDNLLGRAIADVEIVNELNGFIEGRLSQLINLENQEKKEAFEPAEVKMLKGLINKVNAPTKQASNVEIQNQPKIEGPSEISAPSFMTQDNLDPIVKAALEEEQKAKEQPPTRKKGEIVIPANYRPGSPADNNAYAMQQASGNQKRYDKQVQTRQGDHTIAG